MLIQRLGTRTKNFLYNRVIMFKFIRPEFFDIFGIGIFAVITFLGVRGLFFAESVPYWGLIFLSIVGVLGIAIDGIIVYRTYIRPHKNTSAPLSNMVK